MSLMVDVARVILARNCSSMFYIYNNFISNSTMVSRKWMLTLKRSCANWPAINRHTIVPQKTYNDFRNSLPIILNDGLSKTEYLSCPDVKDRIREIIAYHTLERVQVHGQLTILAYQGLEDSKNITDRLYHQVFLMAWCAEMLFSYYLINDDIEDEATTRFGKPCWHMLPNVGTMAVYDSSLMRSFMYELLKHNLDDEMYNKMSKLFSEAFTRCDYGQYLDSIAGKLRNFSKFDMDFYHNVSNNKFSYHSTQFPILIALTLANKANTESVHNVFNALRNIGGWIQMHNDIMDWCDEASTGKSNIDIKKGKPSWLVAAALQRCSSEQRKIFLSHYGREKPEDVERILKLYQELELRDVFCKEHSERLVNISRQIDNLPNNSTPSAEFFHNFIKSLYPFIVYHSDALDFDRKTRQHIYA